MLLSLVTVKLVADFVTLTALDSFVMFLLFASKVTVIALPPPPLDAGH